MLTNAFDQAIENIKIYLEQVEGTCILIGVCDDIVLREHAVSVIRERLPAGIMLHDFRYDAEHLSLLEGAIEAHTLGLKQRRVPHGLEAFAD